MFFFLTSKFRARFLGLWGSSRAYISMYTAVVWAEKNEEVGDRICLGGDQFGREEVEQVSFYG